MLASVFSSSCSDNKNKCILVNVCIVGKGGLEKHLSIRHLKQKFIKTVKYCSIARTRNAFKEKISFFPAVWCWTLAWSLELHSVDSCAWKREALY